MTKEAIIEKYRFYKGVDFLFKRGGGDAEKVAVNLQILYKEQDIGLKFPDSYKKFVLDYVLGFEPYLGHLALDDMEFEMVKFVQKAAFDEDGNWLCEVSYFLTLHDVYAKWCVWGKMLNQELKWDLLQIESNGSVGGLFIGCGNENQGKIYRIIPDLLLPDFEYDPSITYNSHGIKSIAPDIFTLINSLKFNFDIGLSDGY